ncbi:GntR family transcriptional regulator [Marispirochaeta aestuarii]|uniref:GntR family transcriptional regulator n=1 Tax=Marispirochaeta aestuarii TaxID=1963862 RepID=UPI0029C816B4|nr:GntR family transcriptional regulator [Marispirochaeta aestuarii]
MKTAKNKKQLVYEKLRGEILSCKLEPGLPIHEANLAEGYGVSKTPVREAIRQLEREGLISSVPGRGSIVSFISSGDIHEVFEIREMIECETAAKAAKLDDKSELIKRREELYRLKEKLDQDAAEEGWDFCDDIHMVIMEIVKNHRLLQMYRDVLDSISRIRNNYGRKFSCRRLEFIIDEHILVLDAIIDGDEELAQKRVRDHLVNGYQYINSLT